MENGYKHGVMFLDGEQFNVSVSVAAGLISDLGEFLHLDFDTKIGQKNQFTNGRLVEPTTVDLPAGLIESIKADPVTQDEAAQIREVAIVVLTSNIKSECERRIFQAADQLTQMNIIGASAANTLSGPDQAAYVASVAWIAAMRGVCASLIADQDETFADNTHWPDPTQDILDLVAQY